MFLRFVVGKYRYSLLGAAACSILSAGLTLSVLAKINYLVAMKWTGMAWEPLVVLVALLIGMLGASAATQVLCARLGANLIATLRLYLSKKMMQMDYEKLADRKNVVFGALIEDVGRMAPLVVIAPLIAYNVLLIIICAIYLLRLSPLLFAVLTCGLLFPLALSWLVTKSTKVRFRAMLEQESIVFEALHALTDGKKEMSLNAGRATHFLEKILDPAIEKHRIVMSEAHLRLGLNEAWSSTMLYVSIVSVVFAGHVVFGLSVQQVTAFVIGSLFLIGPISFIVHSIQQAQMGFASTRRLEELGLGMPTSANDVENGVRLSSVKPKGWKKLAMKSVTYRYPGLSDSNYGLGPIDLEIARGETVFLVGGNGSGKSTLLMILCGILTPRSGEILMDDQNILSDRRAYQDRFSGVFGDFYLFSHVLDRAGNIASDEMVMAWLEQLQLDQQVEVKDGVLSRLALSTGQRKRVALLNCYAEDREIVFFDEWAADQDPSFRSHFYYEILPALKRQGKTLVVISHDDRFFSMADRVIKMESGCIVSNVVNTGTAFAAEGKGEGMSVA